MENRSVQMTFSIIVVCLNAGEKLRGTIESILSQTERDYEIIIKDGGSADEITKACLDNYRQWNQIRVYRDKDAGIYDAMNQAVQYVRGQYVLFLNCGDRFYDNRVLARVRKRISEVREQTAQAGMQVTQAREQISQAAVSDSRQTPRTSKLQTQRHIFYGNIHECRTDTFVQSNPVIDDFACYRNVPCHQACFYAAELLREKQFDTAYAVRADYEHFLWCYFKGHARTVYMPITVALYEGGGFSETRENEKKSRQEHRKVTCTYMPAAKVLKYRLVMLITLAPLRTWIARNPATAGIYQAIKRKLYQRQQNND